MIRLITREKLLKRSIPMLAGLQFDFDSALVEIFARNFGMLGNEVLRYYSRRIKVEMRKHLLDNLTIEYAMYIIVGIVALQPILFDLRDKITDILVVDRPILHRATPLRTDNLPMNLEQSHKILVQFRRNKLGYYVFVHRSIFIVGLGFIGFDGNWLFFRGYSRGFFDGYVVFGYGRWFRRSGFPGYGGFFGSSRILLRWHCLYMLT
jgi:hypothetical protein